MRRKPGAVKKDVIDFAERESAVLAAWKDDKTTAKTFGKALLYLKAAFYMHGQFTKWLRTNDIDQNRASYCMRVAEGKDKKAREKRKATWQSKAKQEVDRLFKHVQKEPVTNQTLCERVFEINKCIIIGAIKQATAQGGWQSPKDIRKGDDPK